MAVYICPHCKRRVRATGQVFATHNKNRHTNVACPMSREPIKGQPVPALSRTPDDPTTQEQLSGIRALWDNGVCTYDCGIPIMRDDRVIPRGNNTWAHVRCYQEAHA